MCGRFAQYRSRDDYFAALGIAGDEITHDPQPIDRYNVAPGTRVLLLNARAGSLSLDPVHWGYAPDWWQKPPLINARSETAASGRMFSSLWRHGRAIVMADGWYEWQRKGSHKQPWFLFHHAREPLFFAAIGNAPYDKANDHEGFVIVTAASDKGLVDIHDRWPLVLTPEAALAWLDPTTTVDEACDLAHKGARTADEFRWHPVSPAVGNPKNQGADLIKESAPAE